MSSRRRVLIATGNAGKVVETRAILGADADLCTLADAAPVDFPAEGEEYEANARVKALVAARATGLCALADDSGLEVDALDGAPGPLSARYGGPALDDRGRVLKLLVALHDVPLARRGARFVCVAALATPEGGIAVAHGICNGRILRVPRGKSGFGYDPVFQPTGYDEAMAELPAAIKNRISHRAVALRALGERLSAP